MSTGRARRIAVANEKGGVGKTVTVLNLAAALVRSGRKVLVVDMDPQANATRGLGMDPAAKHPNTYQVIRHPGKFTSEQMICPTRWEGLDLIPAHVDLAGAEVELIKKKGRENRLADGLEGAAGPYDFVFLDTPPSLSLLTINVFAYAGELIVPCQTHPYALAALDDLFDTVAAVKEEINPDLHITGIVATLYDQRTRVGQEVLARLQSHERYRALLFNTAIRANTTIAESAAVGKPVVFYRSTSFGATDYLELAEEVVARGSASPT
jgi:chromosome partitioning protein